MNSADMLVMKRSVFLWIGAALVMGLNASAAYHPSKLIIYTALATTALYALVGIGFGIWAARTVTRAASTPQ
jgi:hypothetical protein